MLFRLGQNKSPSTLTRLDFIFVFSIFIVSLTLRLFRIDHQSLWLDEVSSLRNARAFGEGGLVALASVDQVAPLHSIVLWLSTTLLGDDAFSLRLPSAIAGALMVPAMFALARRLSFDRPTAYVACLIVALAPMALWYSQDARMYIFVMLCSTLYIAVAWPITFRNLTANELLSLFVIAVAGLCFHHYMAFVILIFGLFLLTQGLLITKRFWIWSVTQFCGVLVFAAWMFLTLDRLGGAAGSSKPLALFWVPYTLYSFYLGFSMGPSPREIATFGASLRNYSVLDMLVALSAGVSLCVLLASGALRSRHSTQIRRDLFLWAWFLVPALLAVGMTFLTKVQFNVRYTVVSFPAFALLLSASICLFVRAVSDRIQESRSHDRTGSGPARAGLRPYDYTVAAALTFSFVAIGIANANHYFNSRYEKEDTKALSGFLRSEGAGRILVADNTRVIKMLDYYKAPVPEEALTIDYRWTDSTPESVMQQLGRRAGQEKARILLIEYRSWESDRHHALRQRLAEIGSLVKRIPFSGVEVFEFEIAPTAG